MKQVTVGAPDSLQLQNKTQERGFDQLSLFRCYRGWWWVMEGNCKDPFSSTLWEEYTQMANKKDVTVQKFHSVNPCY